MNVTLERVRARENEVAVLAYEARRPRGVSLVVGHGYSSSKHNLDFMCGFLAGHGFGVWSLDFPGHKLGASGGVLRGVDDCIDAMSAVVEHVRANHPGPILTVGHSMGAMTALFTAAADPQVTGAIAIATGYGRPSAIAALKNVGATDFRSGYVDGVALPELVEGLDARYEEALPKLAGRPLLIVAAKHDAMVSRASVEELYARAPEPKTFETIESDHTYAGDNARGALLQWLNERFPRA
ncbi:MAG: lysophospholipase [Candidatus Eremiobacteraeota bacterium]|nr:lysophospholipase [Candidatus Eremiobacteraeota bacterium]